MNFVWHSSLQNVSYLLRFQHIVIKNQLTRRRDKQKAFTNGSAELALFHQPQGDVGQFVSFW